MQIILAFITGLTAGGLSCLAVQGGLLASSIAHQVEGSVRAQPMKRGRTQTADRPRLQAGRPILLFLAAKLVAYTALGFLLGVLGSALQLTATMRAVLQFAIGIFMMGTALRMFDVHPVFRYFALEPPRFVTRFIRRTAKDEAGDLTPLFLGALTVLIPCGVTQAMMAVAMGTGSALMGATILFAFTLGASPVFFTVAYLAARLGSRLEAGFMRLVALIVLVLGFVSIDAGLTLMGSPYALANLTRQASPALASQEPAPAETTGGAAAPVQALDQRTLVGTLGGQDATGGMLRIAVTPGGYRPNLLRARPNQPLQLAMVTDKTYSCARAFVIPALGIEKILPATGTVVIDVPPQKPGSKLFFSCSMGMYSGVIQFDS